MSATKTERGIRWASVLIAIGLLVQLVTFFWIHALAFSAYLVVGLPLVAAGVVVYLLSLLRYHPSSEDGNESSLKTV